MRVAEQHASRSKSVDVRGERLRVSLQTADPVVQIVNSDHQHIGRPVTGSSGSDAEEAQNPCRQQEMTHLHSG